MSVFTRVLFSRAKSTEKMNILDYGFGDDWSQSLSAWGDRSRDDGYG